MGGAPTVNCVALSAYITKQDDKRLRALAKRLDLNKSATLRACLRWALDRYDREELDADAPKVDP